MTIKHHKGRLFLDDLMITISIEEEHRNQTHKMPVEHQPRANLIVGVNKVNLNSKAINKGKATKKSKANKPCWNCGQVGHWAKLDPNKKAKTRQTTVNMVVGGSSGASTSGATEGVPPNIIRVLLLSCGKIGNQASNTFECGVPAKVLVPEHKRKKLGSETVDVVFLGYVEISYTLRFLIIKSEILDIEVNTIVEFHDAVFIEVVFSMKIGIPSSVSFDDLLTSTSIPEHVEKMTNVRINPSSTSLTHEESDEPRRSKRARVVKNFRSDFATYNIEDDPITFKDVIASSEAKQWKEAVKSEMDCIVSNGTWDLVDFPPGDTAIGCKWIFKKKLKLDVTVYKFKARLVAKSSKQNGGINYFDTYSPVARLTIIRVLIAVMTLSFILILGNIPNKLI
ncbi:UNVERIFIED_CONTAM: hypothetical protein Sradi_1900900 [Sesamum radiatum]|uniref:Reverse transcriptase Ty1/copia-type domain-containing protein n=1 Tax=Sesamum radiatum TaxID=300843 RepID=A0AAW2TZB6_SESRA